MSMKEEIKRIIEIAKEKNRARIYYSWWGNAHPKNRLYQIIAPNGELEDYGTKEHCIKIATKMGWNFQVERWHKKHRGFATIIKTNL